MTIDTVYFHITNACNLHCAYCYRDAGAHDEEEIPYAIAAETLREIVVLNPARLVLTGGEPLLRRDLLPLAHEFRAERGTTRLCLMTNGTLVKEECAASLVGSFDEIRVSIDSFREVNDVMRGPGSFDGALHGLECIMRAGGDPIAYITITRMNAAYTEEFMGFLLSRGIRQIHFSALKHAGRSNEQYAFSDYEKIKGIIEGFWQKRFGVRLQAQVEENFTCGVGKFVSISPDGSVYPCHVLEFPEFYLGNVKEESLSSLYRNSFMMKRLRALDMRRLPCYSEYLDSACGGAECMGVPARQERFRLKLKELWGKPGNPGTHPG